MSTIKVLHVVGKSKYGGGVQVILPVALAARDQGWTVDILATDRRFQAEIREAGIGVVDMDIIQRAINPWKDLRDLYLLYRFLCHSDYTLVHTHTSKGGAIGRAAAWLAGIPVIVHTIHGFAFGDHTPWWQRWPYALIEWAASRCCDLAISVSDYHRQFAIDLGVCDPSKIVAIPNGLSAERVRPTKTREEMRRELGVTDGEFVILGLGRMVLEKGFDDVIRCAALLPGKMDRPFTVVMAGDGEDHAKMQNLASRLGVDGRVRFLGFRKDIGDLLLASDLAVLPGLREGLSMSLLEAMAAGKPIITTRIGSNAEPSAGHEAALLVDARNVNQLAEAVSRLGRDHELAQRLARSALDVFEEKYTQQRMVAAYLNSYRTLLEARPEVSLSQVSAR
jgi:glycosyltransferase involved in cell wall biosynthesis